MLAPLTNAEIRKLKAASQRLKATFKIGKSGLSPQFVQSLDEALNYNALIKVKFDEFKEEKRAIAPMLADKTSSHLVMLVGNVAVLYRKKSETYVPQ
jgi:RNA-binding protein